MTLRRPGYLLAGLAALFILTACATSQRHAILTFFFEGVDDKDEPAQPQRAAVQTKTGSLLPAAEDTPWYFHKPYDERKCSACHLPGQSQQLKGKQKEFCFECHTNFTIAASSKVQHFPVKKGKCTACHEPHKATNTNLLIKVGAQLCNDCHDKIAVKKILHQPVKKGRCYQCHVPHTSEYSALLLKSPEILCDDCHQPADMKTAKGHENTAGKTCTQCHDPHQSDLKGLMK